MRHVQAGVLTILKSYAPLTAEVNTRAIRSFSGNISKVRLWPRVFVKPLNDSLNYELDSTDLKYGRFQVSVFCRDSMDEAERIADLVEDGLRLQKPSSGSGVTYLFRLIDRVDVLGETEYAVHLDYRLLAAR